MFRPIAVRHSPASRGPDHADMIAATQARGIGPGRPLSRRGQRDLLRHGGAHRCHLADPRGGSPDMGRVSADGRMLCVYGARKVWLELNREGGRPSPDAPSNG